MVLNERRPEDISFVSPPITSDPPHHAGHRHVLRPRFTPQAIAAHEPFMVDTCRRLLDDVVATPAPDAAIHFAQHLPVLVTAHLLGLPAGEADQFRRWVNEILVQGPLEIEIGRRATYEVIDYFRGQLEHRRLHGVTTWWPGSRALSWTADRCPRRTA